jgi:hypothetical protein
MTDCMANRIVTAVLVAGSLTLGIVAPAAGAQPVLTDEQQIQDVLTRQAQASAALDIAAAAELTCAHSVEAIPGLPTALLGPDLESTLRSDQGSQNLAAQISGVTTALRQAMPGSTAQLAGIDNIVVAGDTATADVTVTFQTSPDKPQTQTTRASLLRQDGQWCTTV